MADDDLAAVWGPDGLATTDPGAIRSVPPVVDDVRDETAPPARVRPAAVVTAPPPGPTSRVVLAGAGVVVLAGVVAALAVFGSGRHRPEGAVVSAPTVVTTPTTVVSAAADLFLGERSGGEPPVTVTVSTVRESAASPTTAVAPNPRLADVEKAAAAFSVAMNRGDCDAFWNLLSVRTHQFLETTMTGDGGDPKAMLCEALQADTPATTVTGPARAVATGRAVVPMEADGDAEDITFVLEGGAWRVDLLAMRDAPRREASSADEVKQLLRDASTAEATVLADDGRFTDDVARLGGTDSTIGWRNGVAPVSAVAGDVYVSLGDSSGSVVCLSAKADNGARFLVKRTAAGGVSYAGGEIPATCDAAPLAVSW